jgi:CBS domain-containing protein
MTGPTIPTVPVNEVMHYGVITAPPEMSPAGIARLMSRNRVHCVVVEGITRRRDDQETLVWGVVSDLDLMRAFAAEEVETSAGEMAAGEIVTVDSSDGIDRVARLMAEHECTHLIVVSPETGEPVGVVSTLDIAQGLALSKKLGQ